MNYCILLTFLISVNVFSQSLFKEYEITDGGGNPIGKQLLNYSEGWYTNSYTTNSKITAKTRYKKGDDGSNLGTIAFSIYKVELKDNIPKKYLNSSARNIKNKRQVSFLKKYIKDYDKIGIKDNPRAAIIIPDKDIIPGAETLSPAYIVFDNYEKILNWNRSLRFALAVCTLKENFKNEI